MTCWRDERTQVTWKLEVVFMAICVAIAFFVVLLGEEMNALMNWRSPPAWIGLAMGGVMPLAYFMLAIHGTVAKRLDRRLLSRWAEVYSFISVVVLLIGIAIGLILTLGLLLARMRGLSPIPPSFLKGYVSILCLGVLVVRFYRFFQR